MLPFLTISDNSEAHHSSISIYVPFSGTIIMLEFLWWSVKKHLNWCFPKSMAVRSSAVRISVPGKIIVFADQRGDQLNYRRPWIMIRYAGCFGIMMDFFKQPQASVQIKAGMHRTIWVHLLWSADSVYFCAFALFWVEIRMITVIHRIFW